MLVYHTTVVIVVICCQDIVVIETKPQANHGDDGAPQRSASTLVSEKNAMTHSHTRKHFSLPVSS